MASIGDGYEKCSVTPCPAFHPVPGVQTSDTDIFLCAYGSSHGQCRTLVGLLETSESARSASAAANVTLSDSAAKSVEMKSIEEDMERFKYIVLDIIASSSSDPSVGPSGIFMVQKAADAVVQEYEESVLDTLEAQSNLQSIQDYSGIATENMIRALASQERFVSLRSDLKIVQESSESPDEKARQEFHLTKEIERENADIAKRARAAGFAAQAARGKGKEISKLSEQVKKRNKEAPAKIRACSEAYNASRGNP